MNYLSFDIAIPYFYRKKTSKSFYQYIDNKIVMKYVLFNVTTFDVA